MLSIENRPYSKLVKDSGKHPWNIQEGVVMEGNLRAEIKFWKDSMSLDGTPYLWVETPDGRFIRTSPVDRILTDDNGGYKIYTKNSLYLLT